ncbi:MFS transporter [Lentzea sp. NPDC004782]|uniref:MFS transporter n=1 Tax=Lentzea sp. NPDC004782 TaxID=3154458 RepID=UPI0033B57131
MTDSPPETTERPRRAGVGRDFSFQISASLFSTLGDGALLAALPLLAKSLTSDARLIAWVSAAATLPWLVLSVLGGAIADRFDRRRLMMGAQVAQALLVGVVAVLATLHLTEIWMLYLLAFGLCCAEILFTNSSQALVPSIVPHEKLETANGRLVATVSVSKEFAGPPLGAALFTFAMPLPFWLNVITFSLSVLLLSRIRARPAAAVRTERSSLFGDVVDGLRWLGRHRLPLTLTVVAGAGNFCETMALSTLVLFAHDVLHVGDRGYGVLLAAMAIGGIVGSLVAGRVVDRFGGLRVAVAVQIVGPLVWLSIGLFGRDAITVVVLFSVFSVALAMWNVVSYSTRQRVVPGELLGRVSGAGRMASYGGLPLGALAGGFLAQQYGLIAPWIVGALLNMVVVAFAVPTLIRHWER